MYSSYFRGGFFADGLFKVDFLGLTQKTSGTDRFPRSVFNANANNITAPTLQLNRGVELDANGKPINKAGEDDIQNAKDRGLTTTTGNLSPGTNNTEVIVDKQGNVCFGKDAADTQFGFTDVQSSTFSSSKSTDYRNFTLASNIGYWFDLGQGYWLEPVGTITFTYANFDSDAAALGLEDGQSLRLWGGSRLGRTVINQPGGYLTTMAVGAFLYSDVLVNGFSATGLSPGPLEQDEGKLRVAGTISGQINWFDGYSLLAEGNVRGGEDYWGIGGRLGGRVEW